MEFSHEKLQMEERRHRQSGWISFGFLIVVLFIIALSAFCAFLLIELNQLKSNTSTMIQMNPSIQEVSPSKTDTRRQLAENNNNTCSKQACEILEKLIDNHKQIPERRVKRNVFSENVYAEWLMFTRWGKATCPQTSQVLNVGSGLGVIAGTHDESGNILHGSEPVCVPEGVAFGPADSVSGAQLHPLKFALNGTPLVDLTTNKQRGYVRCAFCEIRASDKMVVYGSSCPRNWKFMYSGYMVSSSGGAGASICLDDSSVVHQTAFSHQGEMKLVESGNDFQGQGGRVVTCSCCVRALSSLPDVLSITSQVDTSDDVRVLGGDGDRLLVDFNFNYLE